MGIQDGSFLEVPGVARYRIKGGGEILVDPHPEADPGLVRLFLFGTAFGMLCHRRGLVPLHAGCVVIGGRAVAIAGASGAGKSTLVAALASRGHAVVSDDVCVIDWRSPGPPRVIPFAPRLKLTPDSLSAVGLSPELAEFLAFEPQKRDVIGSVSLQKEPVPLAAIYHLDMEAGAAGEEVRPVRGAAALAFLNRNIYRAAAARRMGRTGELFHATARIAGLVPNYHLVRGSDFGGLEGLVRCLSARHGG